MNWKLIYDLIMMIGIGGGTAVIGSFVGFFLGYVLNSICQSECQLHDLLTKGPVELCYQGCPDPMMFLVVGTLPGILIAGVEYLARRGNN